MENKFNIKDKVYHVTPDSPHGVILDIAHYFKGDRYNYLVAWAYNDSTWVWEEELSYDKTII